MPGSEHPDLTLISQAIAEQLTARGETLAVAESACGGLISASLLAVPGASAYFLGGGVVYTARSRKRLLELGKEQVEGLSPMSEAMSLAFAERARAKLDATWGLAELGIAGPGGAVYGFAPGSCVVAVSGPVNLSQSQQTGSDNRQDNMWAFSQTALQLLNTALGDLALK